MRERKKGKRDKIEMKREEFAQPAPPYDLRAAMERE